MITRRNLILAAGASAIVSARATADRMSSAQLLIHIARKQVGVTLRYDPAYSQLAFPNGDVPRFKGVCTDVVIRAYRDAFRIDLQALVNADMKTAFSAYPRRWGLKTTDRNIDHRRVPNLETFFKRQGAALPIPSNHADWRPGDIVTSLVGGTLPHIGIVSDRLARNGNLMVIHNIGSGTREEDALFDHRITGRYRWRI
jgi:uncharacterized protein